MLRNLKPVSMKVIAIPFACEANDLEVTLDSKLNWDSYLGPFRCRYLLVYSRF